MTANAPTTAITIAPAPPNSPEAGQAAGQAWLIHHESVLPTLNADVQAIADDRTAVASGDPSGLGADCSRLPADMAADEQPPPVGDPMAASDRSRGSRTSGRAPTTAPGPWPSGAHRCSSRPRRTSGAPKRPRTGRSRRWAFRRDDGTRRTRGPPPGPSSQVRTLSYPWSILVP